MKKLLKPCLFVLLGMALGIVMSFGVTTLRAASGYFEQGSVLIIQEGTKIELAISATKPFKWKNLTWTQRGPATKNNLTLVGNRSE